MTRQAKFMVWTCILGRDMAAFEISGSLTECLAALTEGYNRVCVFRS